MKLIYNYIIIISGKSTWNQNFNGVFTCIFAKVRKLCSQGHPAVRLSGPNLTTSTACWTTWPVMREQRPGSNAWRVGVMRPNWLSDETLMHKVRVSHGKLCGACHVLGRTCAVLRYWGLNKMTTIFSQYFQTSFLDRHFTHLICIWLRILSGSPIDNEYWGNY